MFDERADIGRVEYEILRVQLESDFDLAVAGQAVCFGPEGGGYAPLVVEHVEGSRIPGVDDPGRLGHARLAARQARHRDHVILATGVLAQERGFRPRGDQNQGLAAVAHDLRDGFALIPRGRQSAHDEPVSGVEDHPKVLRGRGPQGPRRSVGAVAQIMSGSDNPLPRVSADAGLIAKDQSDQLAGHSDLFGDVSHGCRSWCLGWCWQCGHRNPFPRPEL